MAAGELDMSRKRIRMDGLEWFLKIGVSCLRCKKRGEICYWVLELLEAFQWASPADTDKKTMPIDTRYGRLSKLFGGNTSRQVKNWGHTQTEPSRHSKNCQLSRKISKN